MAGSPEAMVQGAMEFSSVGLEKWAGALGGDSAQFLPLIQLVQDPEFAAAAKQIAENPNLKLLYIGLGLVVISHLILKRWILSTTDKLRWRILLRVLLAALFFMALFAVNYAIFGMPLIIIVQKIWGTLRLSF